MTGLARRVLADRRALTTALPPAFVSDAPIEILLVLYIDRADRMPIAMLAAAIGAPVTVVLRWATALASTGHLAMADGAVSLAPPGREALEAALREIVRGSDAPATAH